MTFMDAANWAVAAALSPASTALRTFLTAVRNIERNAELWALTLTV
jgi:hypothetical protein